MGVEFFSCDNCGESVCDAGPYWSCEDCGSRLCRGGKFEHCYEDLVKGKKSGVFNEDNEEVDYCPFCTGEVATDSDLLAFMLDQYQLTREQVLLRYQRSSNRTQTESSLGES